MLDKKTPPRDIRAYVDQKYASTVHRRPHRPCRERHPDHLLLTDRRRPCRRSGTPRALRYRGRCHVMPLSVLREMAPSTVTA